MTTRADMADRAVHRARAVLAWRILAGPLQFGRDWVVGFVQLQGFDRGVALAGQAFTALIPLLIVYSAVVSDATGQDFADQLIRIFDLDAGTASSVKQTFASTSEVESQVTALGVVLLVGSALSFTRGLQRLYQLAFDQPSLGLRAAKWGLIWLTIVIAILTIRPLILGAVHGLVLVVLSLAFATGLWLSTPYVLMAKRIHWRRLVPTALLTGVGMTAFEVSSVIWMPRTVAASAEQFGAIGVAFALLSWLVGAGLVLVAAAAGGAVIDARLRRRADR
jgi:membrane protein